MRHSKRATEAIGRLPSHAVAQVVVVVETIAFWGAVVVPLGYLPTLVLGGGPGAILGLAALNLACLLVGHRHRPSVDASVLSLLGSLPVSMGVER